MKRFSLVAIWIFIPVFTGIAQYTEIINARFPGFGESPYATGTKVYQFETNYFRTHNRSFRYFEPDYSGGLNAFLRTGFLSEKLELNLDIQYEYRHLYSGLYGTNGLSKNGFNRFTFSAKYLFYKPSYKDPSKEIRSWKRKMAYDWNRLIPAVGLTVGMETNFVSRDYRLPGMGVRAALLLQQDLDGWTTLVTNVYADHILYPSYREYGITSALTYAKWERISLFAEGQLEHLPGITRYYGGAGAAYLISEDAQLGLHVRSELRYDYLNLYATAGLAWRIDNHKDKVKKKKYETEDQIIYEKQSFLKRIFSKKGRRGKIPKKKKYRKKRRRGERIPRDERYKKQSREERKRRRHMRPPRERSRNNSHGRTRRHRRTR